MIPRYLFSYHEKQFIPGPVSIFVYFYLFFELVKKQHYEQTPTKITKQVRGWLFYLQETHAILTNHICFTEYPA